MRVAGVRPVSLQQWRVQSLSGSSTSGGSGSMARRVLVHGAAGPVGLLACQLLRGWGCLVTATAQQHHDVTQLSRFAHHVVLTDSNDTREDEERRKQVSCADLLSSHSSPSSSPAPGWLSSVPHLGSYSVFLDCVGGGSSESAALIALSSPTGHFVTLRGSLLPLLDADGLLSGGASSVARLAERKAVFGARGVRYDWAVNRCDAAALRYISAAFDHGLLEVTQPAQIMRGIDSVAAAMQLYGSNKPQSKIVVDLQQTNNDFGTQVKYVEKGAPVQR